MKCIDIHDNYFSNGDLFVWGLSETLCKVKDLCKGEDEMLLTVYSIRINGAEIGHMPFAKEQTDLPFIYKVKKIFNKELTCLI